MDDRVEVDSLVKTYNGNTILSDVSLKLKTGDVVGLFGRNGSGKSTLLHILFGILKADQLYMKYTNQVFLKRNKFNAVFTLSPQFVYLPENTTVSKLLKLCVTKENLPFILNMDQIGEIKFVKMKNLSYGLKKYVQVLSVLYNETKFCLLDEPFNGLSPILSNSLKECILGVSKNKGILISDHSHEELLKITNKNYLLKDGCLYRIRNRKDLVDFNYLPG